MNNRIYQICSRCIMDNNDDPFVVFDVNGVCNHCHTYDEVSDIRLKYRNKGEKEMSEIVEKIKRDGQGSEYDCVIGLSGGVDSTYVAYISKKLGLRPLAVHLDNGWNSELAVINIQNTLDNLGIDLYTYVINWKEFRDMQMAYIKASVVDIEALTDHAITSTLFDVAGRFNIKYVLSGENMETEGVLPDSWVHMKHDHINIKAIHKKFGKIKRKTFPLMSYQKYLLSQKFFNITFVPILNYLPYKKDEAKKLIQVELNWRDYGGKHFESIFTRFYQSYILPTKFKIDKRKSHFSTLICAGQMSREQALRRISEPPCAEDVLQADKEYILKKFNVSEPEFDYLMRQEPIPHTDYPSVVNILKRIKSLTRPILWKNK